MRQLYVLIVFFLLVESAFSQIKKEKGYIGISVPALYNHSSANYYQTSNRNTSSGNAISYGVNLNYIRPVLNHTFLKAGLGYFIQNFLIERPFHFDDPTALLFRTKSYTYDNLNLSIGIGFDKKLKNNLEFEILISYISSNTFKQKYTPTFLSNSCSHKNQVNSKFFHIGEMANIELGIMKKLSSKLSIGGHLVYPFLVYWNKDPIFINNSYSTEEEKIAKDFFSIGISLSAYLSFLNLNN